MKDIIFVENNYFVTVKEHSFKFKHLIDKTEKFIPIEEVELFVFDNVKSYFSAKFVNRCLKEKIKVIFCNEKHSPVGYLESGFTHRFRLERLNLQLKLNNKVKGRIWRKIVIFKIKNQALCLLNYPKLEYDFDRLMHLSTHITEHDKENKEAVSAKVYFNGLFGSEFIRGRYSDAINAGLNYGYSILRAVIKKELAFRGFEQSLGVHHRSTENPFNLADDLIEPFRPFVDMLVYEYIFTQGVQTIDTSHKKKLIEVLMENCIIEDQIMTVSDGIKYMVNSYLSCIENNSASHLKLPLMIGVGR